MHDVVLQLRNSKIVQNVEILEFENTETISIIHIKAILINKTELYVREKTSENGFRYAYHWQRKNGKLIRRWDNVPHHKHIRSFPYHQHIFAHGKLTINKSYAVNLEKVLAIIMSILKT